MGGAPERRLGGTRRGPRLARGGAIAPRTGAGGRRPIASAGPGRLRTEGNLLTAGAMAVPRETLAAPMVRIPTVVEIRDEHARDRPTQEALDGRHVRALLGAHQRERIPRRLNPSGAADAMDVVFRSARHVVVDD